MAAHTAGDDALPSLRVRPRQPQRGVGAALVDGDAPLRHLNTLPVVEEAVPACGGYNKEESSPPSALKSEGSFRTSGYLSI